MANTLDEKFGDFTRYEYAALPTEIPLSEEESKVIIPNALEKFLYHIEENGDKKDRDIADLTRISIKSGATPEVLKDFAERYQEEMNALTIGNLMDFYQSTIDKYFDRETFSKLRNDFGKFLGEKYGDITRKIDHASYILKGVEKGYQPKEEKENAEKVIGQYQKVIAFIKFLEDIKFEKLRRDVVDNHHDKTAKTYKKIIEEAHTPKKDYGFPVAA